MHEDTNASGENLRKSYPEIVAEKRLKDQQKKDYDALALGVRTDGQRTMHKRWRKVIETGQRNLG